MTSRPRVAILMATYNGRAWIEAQCASIFAQQGVDWTLLVSDDASTDGTLEYLREIAAHRRDVVLLPTAAPSGSSAANFARLLREVDLDRYDFFALADQDDIWLPDKLARACLMLRRKAADGYSSNVEALYADGRRALVAKSSPQHAHDHYFESPGPGCSFVMSRRLMQRVVPVLQAIHERSDRVFAYHDWFLYAFARRAGFVWHIDPKPTMLYRQHAHNVLGANIGLLPRWRRLQRIWSGWYLDEVRWQHDILESLSALMPAGRTTLSADLLRLDTFSARLRFCLRVAPEARRRLRDRVWLGMCVFSGILR